MRLFALSLLPLSSACAPLTAGPMPDAFDREHGVEEAFPGARITGQGEVEIAVGDDSSVVVPYVVKQGYAVAGGDMILGDASSLGQRAAMNGDHAAWGCTVPYAFADDLSETSRTNFLGAVAHWEANTGLRFVEDDTATDRIHVQGGSGCSSYVGRIGGAQAMTLASTCTEGSAIHEIGHAIGMFHEQSRTDAAEHIEIFWDNIQPGLAFAFQSWEQRGYHGIDRGAYDLTSVMQYGSWSFSTGTCGQWDTSGCTILTRDGDYITTQRVLSQTDIDSVAAMYPHCVAEDPPDEPTVLETTFPGQASGTLDASGSARATFTVDLSAGVSVMVEDTGFFSFGLTGVTVRDADGAVRAELNEEDEHWLHLWTQLPQGTYEVELTGEPGVAFELALRNGWVHGYPDDPTDPDWQAVIELVQTASLETLDDEVGLDSRAAQAIWGNWGTQSLHELDGLYYVGGSAFDRLYDHVRAQ